MRKISTLLLAAAFVLAVDASYASPKRGDNVRGGWFNRAACSREANKEHQTCMSTCKQSLAQEMKVCQAKNAAQKECLEGCITAKTACIEDVQKPLSECLEAANGVLEGELAVCALLTSEDVKLSCDNAAKVKAFSSRLDCEKQFKLNTDAQGKLKACAKAAQGCYSDCKSLPPSTPTPLPTAEPGQ